MALILSEKIRFLLVLLVIVGKGDCGRCNVENPVYASILATDISSLPSQLVYSERPYVIYKDNKLFYFDQVKDETCYLKEVLNLNYSNPRLSVYSYYSNFEDYEDSFKTKNEEKSDGLVISIRGTKRIIDVYNDIQLLLKKTPDYFYKILDIVEKYKKNNPASMNKLTHFIGHSLGALLAEMFSVYYNTKAISFDCPGSKNLISQMVEKYKIPQEQVDKVIANNITTYVSMPNIVNKAFPKCLNSSYVIYNEPYHLCEVYFYRNIDILNIKLKYIPENINDLEGKLWWNIYYHIMYNMRDAILLNYKGSGYEVISKYETNKLNSKSYVRDPKNDRFFRKFYECMGYKESDKPYYSFKEEIIKEYEDRLVEIENEKKDKERERIEKEFEKAVENSLRYLK